MIPSTTFDVNASFPAEDRYRPAVEALVAQAAEQAGCSKEVARRFAGEVGQAFGKGAGAAAPGATVGVRVERAAGTIEVAVSCGDTVRLSRSVTELR